MLYSLRNSEIDKIKKNIINVSLRTSGILCIKGENENGKDIYLATLICNTFREASRARRVQ